MKKILLLSFTALFAISCNSISQKVELKGPQLVKGTTYGDSVFDNNIQSLEAVKSVAEKSGSTNAKITGVITEVCQKKGCWLKVKSADGEDLHVTFKNYAFFVPKDIAGKTVVLDGIAKMDTVSVETQRHYAEDAGKSQEEINKITTSKVKLSFEAKGVVVI
jgi:hypothetical protein